MNRPLIVLADPDANYLIPLEDKLVEALCEQAELEVITDQAYFDTYFSTPRKIDNLIISDSLFSQELRRHNITHIFVLTETPEEHETTGNTTRIFKYSSTKEIFNQILFKSRDILDVRYTHKETQVIAVSSAIGGSGKTTVALSVSAALANNHKRVLFISTDDIQGFSYYLQDKAPLSNDVLKACMTEGEELYAAVKPYIRHEGYSYLPPFGRSIASLGLTFEVYSRIVSAVRASGEYDYVVVDMATGFSQDRAKLFRDADRVIMIILQDAYSTYKTAQLLQNMDCTDSEKFMFVCNKFRRDIPNTYMNATGEQQFVVAEYIEEIQAYKDDSLNTYMSLQGVHNLAYIFS